MTSDSAISQPVTDRRQLTDRFSEFFNPIVVRELRQAVRSRFVTSMLLALLVIQLTAIAIYLLSSPSTIDDLDGGRNVFQVLLAVLLGVSLLFVPLYTAIRLVIERSDTNVDLLYITTIRPRSIIAGKMFAALILIALIFSTCLPFMTFTWMLRGIDIPTIFVLLIFAFLIIVLCTQIAVFAACVPLGRVLRTIFGLLLLGFFTGVYGLALSASYEMIRSGVGSQITSIEFREGAGAFLLFVASVSGLFFALSVALIKPLAANRAFPVRLYITIAWIVTGVAAAIFSVIENSQVALCIWQVLSNALFAIALFVAVSERDEPGRRVTKSIPPSAIRRIFVFPFFSGAASGLFWAAMHSVLTLMAAWVWTEIFWRHRDNDDLVQTIKFMGGLTLYFYVYALSGALLRRYLFRKIATELTWVLGAILLGLGVIAPFLFGFLFAFGETWQIRDVGAWFIGNPFAFGVKSHRVLYATIGLALAAIVTAFTLPWFFARLNRFHPSALNKEINEEVVRLGI